MPFTVNTFVADAANDILTVDWEYSNVDGTIGNTLKLATPAGDVPVANVTQATLVSWVEDQLENTTEEFDKAIANAKAQVVYQSGFKRYNLGVDNTYAIATEEEAPVSEAEVVS